MKQITSILALLSIITVASCEKIHVDDYHTGATTDKLGVLSISNISGDRYEVIINDEDYYNRTFKGGESRNIELEVGNYEVKYRQLEGYTFWATTGSKKVYIHKKQKTEISIPE